MPPRNTGRSIEKTKEMAAQVHHKSKPLLSGSTKTVSTMSSQDRKSLEERGIRMAGMASPMTKTRPTGARASVTNSMKKIRRLIKLFLVTASRQRERTLLSLVATNLLELRVRVILLSVQKILMTPLAVTESFFCPLEPLRTPLILLQALQPPVAHTIQLSCPTPKTT